MPRNRSHRNTRGGARSARANRHADPQEGVSKLSEDALYDLVRSEPDILLLILDGVQDPHNLGACLRTADGAGARAIITPKHHSASVTETVIRIACGAASAVPVVAVTNLARCMEKLQGEFGVRVVGTADEAGTSLYDADFTGPLAIAMGAEEKGLRRLTQEKCDELVQIPMLGNVECLNVSAAAAVCLFEAVRQRQGH